MKRNFKNRLLIYSRFPKVGTDPVKSPFIPNLSLETDSIQTLALHKNLVNAKTTMQNKVAQKHSSYSSNADK